MVRLRILAAFCLVSFESTVVPKVTQEECIIVCEKTTPRLPALVKVKFLDWYLDFKETVLVVVLAALFETPAS